MYTAYMFIDISRPIHAGMAIYPNNPAVDIELVQMAKAGKSQISRISMGSHTGTHIDARSHITYNASGIESYSLEQYIGPVDVVEIPSDIAVIHAEDIPQHLLPRVIFKTRNSSRDSEVFEEDFVALGEDAARELVSRNIQLVGIDALSIKKKGVADQTHALLLKKNIVILEGLYLADVPAGQYQLICLPLSIAGVDGVPARVILAPLVKAQ